MRDVLQTSFAIAADADAEEAKGPRRKLAFKLVALFDVIYEREVEGIAAAVVLVQKSARERQTLAAEPRLFHSNRPPAEVEPPAGDRPFVLGVCLCDVDKDEVHVASRVDGLCSQGSE